MSRRLYVVIRHLDRDRNMACSLYPADGFTMCRGLFDSSGGRTTLARIDQTPEGVLDIFTVPLTEKQARAIRQGNKQPPSTLERRILYDDGQY